MAKSYDVSKNFSGNQKGMIKDQFDFSPAQNDSYNYKDCVVGGIHVGAMAKEKSMYSKSSRGEQKRMSRMEQDREID
jgi:hypothetical protein